MSNISKFILACSFHYSRTQRRGVRKLSKKSKPGDGTHGKGVRGMKHEEFKPMFQNPVEKKKDEKPAENASEQSES